MDKFAYRRNRFNSSCWRNSRISLRRTHHEADNLYEAADKDFPNFVVFFSSSSKINVYKARFIEIPLYNEFNLFLKEIPV